MNNPYQNVYAEYPTQESTNQNTTLKTPLIENPYSTTNYQTIYSNTQHQQPTIDNNAENQYVTRKDVSNCENQLCCCCAWYWGIKFVLGTIIVICYAASR